MSRCEWELFNLAPFVSQFLGNECSGKDCGAVICHLSQMLCDQCVGPCCCFFVPVQLCVVSSGVVFLRALLLP